MIWRVDRRSQFAAFRSAHRGRVGPLTVSWVEDDSADPPRVAFAIGRRAGSAVVRNRLRRRLRMLMREAAPQLPSGSYLIGASPDVTRCSFNELRMTLRRALAKATGPACG
ncbi:MAG: ribonuclease P protein component [Actinomycetes bacterium]